MKYAYAIPAAIVLTIAALGGLRVGQHLSAATTLTCSQATYDLNANGFVTLADVLAVLPHVGEIGTPQNCVNPPACSVFHAITTPQAIRADDGTVWYAGSIWVAPTAEVGNPLALRCP